MVHSFDAQVACECGVYAAIFLQEIWFWCEKNEQEGINFFDGKYWTYNTIQSYLEKFPYMSIRQLRTAIEKLRECGYIVTGNYNRNTFDRTVWYSVTEKAKLRICQNDKMENHKMTNGKSQNDKSICQNEKIHFHKTTNPFAQNDKSYNIYNIYNNNTDNDTDNNTDNNTDIDTPPRPPKKPPKKKHGEYQHVMLTDAEMDRLIADYGQAETEAAIKYLDEYIEEKGYKAKSHNLSMRRWVFDAVKRTQRRASGNSGSRDYDWESIERSLKDDG